MGCGRSQAAFIQVAKWAWLGRVFCCSIASEGMGVGIGIGMGIGIEGWCTHQYYSWALAFSFVGERDVYYQVLGCGISKLASLSLCNIKRYHLNAITINTTHFVLN
jgi:hypothetical protein